MTAGPPPSRLWSGRGLPRWAWWGLMVLPWMFILAGSVLLIDGLIFAGKAERALGTVVSVERIAGTSGSSASSSHAYLPTISYADLTGTEYEAVTHISATHYDYAPGAPVEILYDPQNPGTVRIAGFLAQWGLPALFIGLGWIFLMSVRFVRRKVSPPG